MAVFCSEFAYLVARKSQRAKKWIAKKLKPFNARKKFCVCLSLARSPTKPDQKFLLKFKLLFFFDAKSLKCRFMLYKTLIELTPGPGPIQFLKLTYSSYAKLRFS